MKILILFLVIKISEIDCSHFTDKWAVNVKGGELEARRLADQYGFTYLGKIMPDMYHFQHKSVEKRSAHPSMQHQSLGNDPQVLWLEQQVAKKRVSRGTIYDKRGIDDISNSSWPNDVQWENMWYLNGDSEFDMRIREAWEMGYTGKGVVVTIVDDGLETNHPDLQQNYDPAASYDVNDDDVDPQPRYDITDTNRHGTRCAGVVAAVSNNNRCVIGVAFNVNIGGIRMLDGEVTDAVEAASISFKTNYIDIYSASWGPTDNGRTVDGPGPLTWKAFRDGIKKGRNGLGNIFVWASGNGGPYRDSCNCDGYTNSIYTLSISGVTESSNIPWYSEACSSTLASTAGSGSVGEKWIVTTDIRQSCTAYHSGTSASVAIAAGLCALALEANPLLTWRDMQHIVVRSSTRSTLKADDWVNNGAGKEVSHAYGFGLMDGLKMVKLAKVWKRSPPQHRCVVTYTDYNVTIPYDGNLTITLSTDGCFDSENNINYLEHVQAAITIIAAERRGEIELYLTSPMGTRSTLLSRRNNDYRPGGFDNWPFMTTHNWGENPNGTWTLEIKNGGTTSELSNWTLILLGTETSPFKDLPPIPDTQGTTITKPITSTNTTETTLTSTTSEEIKGLEETTETKWD